MAGWRVERREDCRPTGNPWKFPRREAAYDIGFGGSVSTEGEGEAARYRWAPAEKIQAVSYDTPIVGWRGEHVNTLRLWHARAPHPIKLQALNPRDHPPPPSEQNPAPILTPRVHPFHAHP